MDALTWPRAKLPLADSIELLFPFNVVEGTPDEAMSLLPDLERAMRDADPSIRSVSAAVVHHAAMRDFLGRTIAVYPLALQVTVHLSCDVLPQDRTRRQAQLVRGVYRAASRPERG